MLSLVVQIDDLVTKMAILVCFSHMFPSFFTILAFGMRRMID